MTAALEGVSGQQNAPAALYPRERPGTHFTGGWVGPRAGLDGRKISSPLGFDPGLSARSSVAIPTELPVPHVYGKDVKYIRTFHKNLLHSHSVLQMVLVYQTTSIAALLLLITPRPI